jgi:hypothetical protein
MNNAMTRGEKRVLAVVATLAAMVLMIGDAQVALMVNSGLHLNLPSLPLVALAMAPVAIELSVPYLVVSRTLKRLEQGR